VDPLNQAIHAHSAPWKHSTYDMCLKTDLVQKGSTRQMATEKLKMDKTQK